MVSGIEGVGEAVTGGMLARAVEPQAGEGDGHTQETACLNCGAALVGPFCHQCGQKAHVHRTLGAFWHDLLHGAFHFEGKIWRTLPMLAWRPGELTRRYFEGERARYVSPIAIFLFSVFLMFAVFSLVGGPFVDANSPAIAEARRDVEREAAVLRARAGTLERERNVLAAAGRPTDAVEARLTQVRNELRALETMETIVVVPNNAPDVSSRVLDLRGDIDTGWPLLDRGIEKARENPSLLIYKLQTNAYKFSWALIPISVPFVWLLFLHRRRYRAFTGYDHTIFVTYSIAFMSLLLITLSLLRPLGLGATLIGLAFVLVPPAHMYRQLRGAYSLSWWSALWRTAVLIGLAFVAIILFFLLLLAVGVLG